MDSPGIEKADVEHDRGGIEEGEGMSARNSKVHAHHAVTYDMPILEDSDIMANVAVVSGDFVKLSYRPFSLVE